MCRELSERIKELATASHAGWDKARARDVVEQRRSKDASVVALTEMSLEATTLEVRARLGAVSGTPQAD